MALEKQQTHRSGALKQTNKAHKHGRHQSKGAINASKKGKVNVKVLSKKKRNELNKEQRRNQSVQIRKNKRDDVLNKKRMIGGYDQLPHLVCVIPLHKQMGLESTLTILKECDPEAVVMRSPTGVIHVSLPRFKQRFAIVIPPAGNMLSMLDTLKVSDSVLFLISATAGLDFGAETIDAWGNDILASSFAQGLPTPTVALVDLSAIPVKKQNDRKQLLQKSISKWFPEEKLVCLDKTTEAINVFRKIGNQKRKSVLYRDRRPHLYSEHVEYIEQGSEGTLKVTGYLRGSILSVNDLIYIPGLGSFQMSQIDAPFDPYITRGKNESENESKVVRVLEKANPAKQESLISENEPDPLDGEQTWPTDQEIEMSQAETKKKKMKTTPWGWSDYQAAWIPDEDAEDIDDLEDESEDEDELMEAMSEEDSEIEEAIDDSESVAQTEINDHEYDKKINFATEQAEFMKIKAARIDKMFPDEVDTPQDSSASVRFQKYRGLESFRTSPWDPKENLPSDYARLFQFKNFEHTKRTILNKKIDKEGAMPGWYITIHVKAVSELIWKNFVKLNSALIVMGMFPHENKMSTLNVVLKRTSVYDEPIKSKERLVFQCGYRRFIVNPIFSQHTNGSKHKFERFFQPESTCAATFYAPIQYSPAPILCFKEFNGELKLVATGSLLSCNPDRIIIKRVALSGHPFKVNKKSAVIRFMFFNPEDISYFKSCKLRTKHGRVGHIKEALGTHGHMKCVFDGQLKSQDTVLLNLYKRMFPKWHYEECIVTCKDEDDRMEL